MDIKKQNLIINKNFDKYTFDSSDDNGVFLTVSDNMTLNSIYLILETKPIDSTSGITITLNGIVDLYLFPTSNTNVSFGVGEMIQTVDNNSIFIITNHVSDNKFALRLVWTTNGINYTLKNNTQSIIYNKLLEEK